METKKELKVLLWITVLFLGVFFLPVGSPVFNTAIQATMDLAKWYAREHVILCLLPAFLIAGVISIFVSQASVIKYFGAKAKRWVAYTVASMSHNSSSLSCTIFPTVSQVSIKRGAALVQQ